ncbi:MAG: ATP-binding protein [Minwuia sp.]|nr:ATP-binding protein [Minwuia sp.]
MRRLDRRMSVSTKFTAALALIMLVMIGAIGVAFNSMNRMADGYDGVATHTVPKLTSAARLDRLSSSIASTASKLAASQSDYVRITIANRLDDSIQSLDDTLRIFDHDESDPKIYTLVLQVRDNRDTMSANLNELSTVVAKRINAGEKTERILDEADRLSNEVTRLLNGTGDVVHNADWLLNLGWALEALLSIRNAESRFRIDRIQAKHVDSQRAGSEGLRRSPISRELVQAQPDLSPMHSLGWKLDAFMARNQHVFELSRVRLALIGRENGLLSRNKRLSSRLTSSVSDLFHLMQTRIDVRNEELRQLERESDLTLMFAFLVSVALILGLLAYLRLDVLKRISDLQRAILRHVDGDRVEIPVHGRDEIADIGQSLRYLVGVISEREQNLRNARINAEHLADSAESASRAKSMFLANMSHELRTPLNAIIGFSEMITHFDGNPARSTEYAGYISSSGKHLLNVINDVLDYSKIEAGKMDLQREDVQLMRLVENINPLVEFQLQTSQLALQYDIPAHLLINVDSQALRQMLVNLLSNAIKFSYRGSTITIRARVRQETFEISVIDQGAGIPAAQLDMVMKPFRQARNDYVASTDSGTGLGLAIVDNLMRLHHGRVKISSTEKKGTEVQLVFPVDVVVQHAAPALTATAGRN